MRGGIDTERHRPSQRQTELQQAKETVTEEDGPLAERHTGNETSYSGLLSAAGSVFNALFMRLQSNSKQSGNRTEKVGVCVCVLALSAGGWGRMSEKVASALKLLFTARAFDCRVQRVEGSSFHGA